MSPTKHKPQDYQRQHWLCYDDDDEPNGCNQSSGDSKREKDCEQELTKLGPGAASVRSQIWKYLPMLRSQTGNQDKPDTYLHPKAQDPTDSMTSAP